jgi:hypothetical protein
MQLQRRKEPWRFPRWGLFVGTKRLPHVDPPKREIGAQTRSRSAAGFLIPDCHKLHRTFGFLGIAFQFVQPCKMLMISATL